MPLRAIRNGADVVSYEYDEVSWNKLKTSYKKETLIMPCCENKAIPKVSKLGNYFFAHARKRQCLSAPETFEHIHLKTRIAKIAASLGYDVTTEKVGETPEGERWIADVFLTKGQAKLAMEIQLASQTVSEFQRRQAKYRVSDVRTLWLYKRRRTHDIPCDYDMPAFEIEAQDESGTFIVPMFDVDVNEFVSGALQGKLRWEPQKGDKLVAKLRLDTLTCWRCKKDTTVILGVDFHKKEGPRLGEAPFSGPFDSDNGIPKFISRHVDNSILSSHRIGPLKKRYSKTMQTSYLSNGCYSCDAIQGNWFIYEAWIDRVYDNPSDAILEFPVGYEETICYIENRWYFGQTPACNRI